MEFSTAFSLLLKFTKGLPTLPPSGDDMLDVARYLGIDLTAVQTDDYERILVNELSNQNRFLATELASDAIFGSDEYQKSMFIREIVANNRENSKR